MRFMASRSWSSWWAELSASRRMSVSFISFSLSSLRSCITVSASLSKHSDSLRTPFGDVTYSPAVQRGRRWFCLFTEHSGFHI